MPRTDKDGDKAWDLNAAFKWMDTFRVGVRAYVSVCVRVYFISAKLRWHDYGELFFFSAMNRLSPALSHLGSRRNL